MTRRGSGVLHAVLALAVVVATAGCASTGDVASEPHLFQPGDSQVTVDTPALRAEKVKAGIADCPRSVAKAKARAGGLPDITLPCLGGGRDVNLAGLSGAPTLINLWAQYCGPCRTEAPLLEQFHRAAGDRVRVVGLDWQDSPGKALAFADELGMTYPQLADPDGVTRGPLRVQGLPATVLVDAQGKVVHVEYGPVTSAAQLSSLVSNHLGVDVAAVGQP